MPRLYSLPLAAAVIAVLAASAAAQQPPAPGKPYRGVAITPPAAMSDADFTALRGKVAEAAKNRDRAALAKLVAGKGFFWDRDGADAAKSRPGMDVLAAALGLANKDGVGWDMLSGFADDPTASPPTSRKGVVCSPAEPRYDAKAFAALLKSSQTDTLAWGYPSSADIEVRAAPQASAPVIDKLGLTFVRMLPEGSVNPNYVRVLTPAGKVGFVTVDALAPVGNDQLCYVNQGGAWKIGGYIGAGEP